MTTMPCGNTAALAAYERQQSMWDAAESRRAAHRKDVVAGQISGTQWTEASDWAQYAPRVDEAAWELVAATLRGDADGIVKFAARLHDAAKEHLEAMFDASNSLEEYL